MACASLWSLSSCLWRNQWVVLPSPLRGLHPSSYRKPALWDHKLHSQGLPVLPLACMHTSVVGFLPVLRTFEGQVQVVLRLRQGLLPESHRCSLCDPLMCSDNWKYSYWIPVSSSVAFGPSQTLPPPCRRRLAYLYGWWPRPGHHLTSLPPACPGPSTQGFWKLGGGRAE